MALAATYSPSATDLGIYHAHQADWCLFATEILGVRLDSQQQAILRGVQHNRRVTVRSGHARGKDFVAAVASLCFLYLCFPCKVINTAPTQRQVRDIMMAEIGRIYNQAAARGAPLGGSLSTDSIRFPGSPEWYLLGFKAADKATEDWTGFHAPNIFVVATEFSGIAQETSDAMEGLLTGNSRFLGVGNPNHCLGEFHSSFQSPLYKNFTLSCLDAPNVVARKIVIPGQVDWEWVNEHVLKQGWTIEISPNEVDHAQFDFKWEGKCYRPTDLFRVKVLGEFPAISEDVLIPLPWIEAANERWRTWRASGKPATQPLRLGVDVAGMGNDSTVYAHRRHAIVTHLERLAVSDHMAVAEDIVRRVSGEPEAEAEIDTIGEGAGVCSRAIQLIGERQIVSAKFSESAAHVTDVTGERRFVNQRAACHWAMRDSLDPQLGGCLALPPDQTLTEDLTAITWKTKPDGKIILEPKEDIKARLGRSPDDGDAVALTFFIQAPEGETVETYDARAEHSGVTGEY